MQVGEGTRHLHVPDPSRARGGMLRVGHVFMVLTQGFFNNMRSMISGWYKEKVPTVIEAPVKAPPTETVIAEESKISEEYTESQAQTPHSAAPAAKIQATPAPTAANAALSTAEKEAEKNEEPKS